MKLSFIKAYLSIFLLLSGPSYAQSKNPGDGKEKKMKAENLEYKFKLGWFTLGGGSLSFQENSRIINNDYHHVVKAHAYTDGMAAFFTDMDDDYLSIINSKSLQPYFSEKHVTIKNGFWDQWNQFDREKNIIDVKAIKTKKDEKDPRAWKVNMTDDSYDIVSTLVYFMDVNWFRVPKGDTVTIRCHYDKKVYPVCLIYNGIEKIKFEEDKVSAHRVQIYFPEDRKYTVGRPIFGWMSTDGRNIPLVIQSKMAFGNARCELTAIDGEDPDF
ncbi:DUF3108 domain-containing protein [Reichenbachiella ulvae]|uniref:DUF3108 domain-containing protein n=1 Tax=Reichenbachiella ulvae TaxID=2980104 RepID=A0ABT3CR87_9BACT|nr:DUF3108 domain-containing protein [Reichenbachiella ulvae]MCV9385783.1 DUF3108 domain-containing protein [Reichenbachiella ulvae]